MSRSSDFNLIYQSNINQSFHNHLTGLAGSLGYIYTSGQTVDAQSGTVCALYCDAGHVVQYDAVGAHYVYSVVGHYEVSILAVSANLVQTCGFGVVEINCVEREGLTLHAAAEERHDVAALGSSVCELEVGPEFLQVAERNFKALPVIVSFGSDSGENHAIVIELRSERELCRH